MGGTVNLKRQENRCNIQGHKKGAKNENPKQADHEGKHLFERTAQPDDGGEWKSTP